MIKISSSSDSVDSELAGKISQSFDQLLDRSDIGFFELPNRPQNWNSARECAEALRARYDSFVFVGIGGSGLGGRTISGAFQTNQSVYFLENVDPFTVDSVLSRVALDTTAFILTSKSGGTLETLALANELEARLQEKGLSLKGRSVVVTEPKDSPLVRWGKSFEALTLEIPFDVGGRFSVLTPVGLLPAAVLGQDVNAFREGALWSMSQKDLLVELSSLIHQSFVRKEWITQFWMYSDRLATLGQWLQQLWAESLAKKVTSTGGTAPRVSTPMACVGAIDQHSILQQVAEGERDKFVLFFNILDEKDKPVPNLFPELSCLDGNGLQDVLRALSRGTLQALAESGVSYCRIDMETLDAKSLGAVFMLFELVIGTLGEFYNINAFDQPGVERGKVLAKEILDS